MSNITPHDIGIDIPGFDKFYPDQIETAFNIIESRKRFVALSGPPGVGKTFIYYIVIKLLEARSCILTITTGLQDQLTNAFPDCVSIMGMSRYDCRMDGDKCDTGRCVTGELCEYKEDGCYFFDRVRQAKLSSVVSTNYDFGHYGRDLGKFDFLILDEADRVMDKYTDMLGASISAREMKRLTNNAALPQLIKLESTKQDLINYLQELCQILRVEGRMSSPGNDILCKREVTQLNKLSQRVDEDPDNWVLTDRNGYGCDSKFRPAGVEHSSVKITPVWPGKYLQQEIYKDIKKILFVSATITRNDIAMLGIGPNEYDFVELGSPYPPKHRPFIYVKTSPSIKVDFKMSDADFRYIVRECFDRVIGDRVDRKGIIHCRSYKYQEMIAAMSSHSNIMLLNQKYNTGRIIEAFKEADAPCVLVSPSVESGYDFRGDECEYQIILKTPYTDKRSDVMAKRCKQSKAYSIDLVVKSLIQMYGRSTRSLTDESEVFIFDLHYKFFYEKNRVSFAKWFREANKVMRHVPKPGPRRRA